LFDAFSIPLVHGWLVDPQNKEFHTKIKDLSYNEIVEKYFENQDEEMKKFLNSSQLTIYGLMKLHELKNGSLSILFRNNHFSTLCKYQDQLYCLVTDEGYKNKPDIVWEKIQDEEGDTLLCKGDFSIYSPKKIPERRREENTDDDFCSIS
jgi:hypothetical protein